MVRKIEDTKLGKARLRNLASLHNIKHWRCHKVKTTRAIHDSLFRPRQGRTEGVTNEGDLAVGTYLISPTALLVKYESMDEINPG